MSVSPFSSPDLRASAFADSYPSPLFLDTDGTQLVDTLQKLCDSASTAPSYTEYQIGSHSLKLYAVSKESGGIFISSNLYKHDEEGSATLIGWCESSDGLDALQDLYSWAAIACICLESEPLEVKGQTKEIVKL